MEGPWICDIMYDNMAKSIDIVYDIISIRRISKDIDYDINCLQYQEFLILYMVLVIYHKHAMISY